MGELTCAKTIRSGRRHKQEGMRRRKRAELRSASTRTPTAGVGGRERRVDPRDALFDAAAESRPIVDAFTTAVSDMRCATYINAWWRRHMSALRRGADIRWRGGDSCGLSGTAAAAALTAAHVAPQPSRGAAPRQPRGMHIRHRMGASEGDAYLEWCGIRGVPRAVRGSGLWKFEGGGRRFDGSESRRPTTTNANKRDIYARFAMKFRGAGRCKCR
jgi:hypothetical protein